MNDEIYYSIALTRMTGFNQQMALQLYQTLGSAMAVYEHRNDIGDVVSDTTPRLREAMKNWDDALKRAAAEMAFTTKNNIRVLTLGDADYPQRLSECPDAPLLLYYKGSADLNQRYVLNIVGTRHCTAYGQDLVRLCDGRGVDHLAVEGRIDRGDIGDIDTDGLRGLEHLGSLDGAAFVPPESGGRGDEEKESGDDPLEGSAQPAAIACLGYFLIGHNLSVCG